MSHSLPARMRIRWRGWSLPDGDPLEDVLARLLADTGDADDLLRPAELLQSLHRVDAELGVEGLGRPGAEPADLEEGEEPRWELAAHGLEPRDLARGQVLVDAAGEVFADGGKLLEPAARGDGLDVLRERLEGLGPSLGRAHAEDALALDLEEARHLVKQARDLEVLHAGMLHSVARDRGVVHFVNTRNVEPAGESKWRDAPEPGPE